MHYVYYMRLVVACFKKQLFTNTYNDQQFSILTRTRSAFHLLALEATYIKTLKTNSMPPERIRLFLTNFPLVSVSQHNAKSIAIFRYNATLFRSIQLSRHFIETHRAQSIGCFDDPQKTTHLFYSSDDS